MPKRARAARETRRLSSKPILAALAVGTTLSLPRAAHAYHTPSQRLTDDTADTLEQGGLRLGLFRIEYTPLKDFTVGTYPLPWFLRVANLHLKWRYWAGEQLSLSARLGYSGFNTENLDRIDEQKTTAFVAVIPFDVAGTYRFNPTFSLSLDLIWTSVYVKGTLDQQAFDGTFQGGTTNLQSLLSLEARLGKVTSLLLQPRFLSYQLANYQGDVVLHPDEFTTIEVHGAQQSDALDFRGAYSLTLSALFSWERFNLRLGVGYGNYNVPGINFMLPERSLFPDLDFYWIW
jgi:hypothetical protein